MLYWLIKTEITEIPDLDHVIGSRTSTKTLKTGSLTHVSKGRNSDHVTKTCS
jgi:hypothetical protein